MTGLTSSVLHVVTNPLPLYLVACAMAVYNLIFKLNQRDPASGEGNVERNIFWQIAFDLTALTLLLYFSDLPRNPFLFFFVFHMIIAGMYLRGSTPYFFAAFATGLAGVVMLTEYLGWVPRFALKYPTDAERPSALGRDISAGRIRRFGQRLVDRRLLHHIHPPLRRPGARRNPPKGKNAGHRAVGGRHRPSNRQPAGRRAKLPQPHRRARKRRSPSDRIRAADGRGPPAHRTHGQARQAFARPRGITLQSTDVNQAVQATLEMLGPGHGKNIKIHSELGDVAPVQGDSYTLQEVLFNLCTNALNAMPTRRHAYAAHLCPGPQGRGPDGLGGHRRLRHRRGHPAAEPGKNLRALLHHPRRFRRHRPRARACAAC